MHCVYYRVSMAMDRALCNNVRVLSVYWPLAVGCGVVCTEWSGVVCTEWSVVLCVLSGVWCCVY